MSPDDLKRQAAARALACVRPGMRLGLGTGSTAKHFVDLLGEKVKAGLQVTCVPTSEVTATQARSLNIPLATLDEIPELDLTVDGADEIDDQLQLIKGAGAALLREKIVAAASKQMIVIADASKHVKQLGAFALPIEVIPFGLEVTKRAIVTAAAKAGAHGPVTLRMAKDGGILVTDGGHYIVDGAFGAIPDAAALAQALNAVPGVVEHGLFIGLATGAVIAGAAGTVVMGSVPEA